LGEGDLRDYHWDRAQELAEPAREAFDDHRYRALRAKQDYDFKRAERECLKALELEPDHIPSLLLLAEVLILRERWDDALKVANKVLRLKAGDVGALRWRAEALRMLGRDEDEHGTIEAALSELVEHPTTLLAAGDSALMRGRHKEALVHYRRAWELEPDLEAAQIGVCEALRSRNPLYRLTVRIALAWARTRRSAGAVWILIVGLIWAASRFGSGVIGDVGYFAMMAFVVPVVALSLARSSLQDFWLQFRREGREALPRRFKLAANIVAPLTLLGAAGLVAFYLVNEVYDVVFLIYGSLAIGIALPLAVAVKFPEDLRWIGYGATGLCWAAAITTTAYGLLGSSSDTFFILYYIFGGTLFLSLFLRVDATRLRLRR